MFGYIYKITNKINGKYYIGKRYGSFDPNYFGSGYLIEKAVNKYGKENFDIFLLLECYSEEEINQKEILFIEQFNPAYNIARGGTGGDTLKYSSEEYKKEITEKRRISLKETYAKLTQEEKVNWGNAISNGKKGKSNGLNGYKQTSEWIRKRVESTRIAIENKSAEWHLSRKEIGKELRKKYEKINWVPVKVNGIIYENKKMACDYLKISPYELRKKIKLEEAEIVNNK